MKVKSNLDTILYDHIVESLILGEFTMGQTVLIDELAEKYEVSRTPVIQAVKILVNEGLLETMTNGRIKVPEFNEEQMRKICEVRLVLENYAIERIFELKQKDDMFYQRLSDIADKGIKSLQLDDKLEFNKRDLEFHRTLVSGCDNEYLSGEYKRIQGNFIVANYLMKPLDKRDFQGAAESHVELVKLLRSHEVEKSLELMRKHIFSFSTPF